MAMYALLLRPSANRVYADAAVDLAIAELSVFDRVLTGRLADLAPVAIAGVPYIGFTADLGAVDLAYLANASTAYALFERVDRLLLPVPMARLDQFDDDLVTIPKYAGKTNEQFTKLLLNVTVLSSAAAGEMLERKLRVFDPLCGRGTTLNQALTYGYDAAGMDLDGKDFDAYAGYIRTYLKRKRLKHNAESGPVRRDRRVVGRRLRVSLSAAKPRGDPLDLDVVHADATAAGEFFRPGSFDAIVTDAPYGVHHGSRTVAAGLRRSPVDLLATAVPAWTPLLRSGGAMGIAVNVLVASRRDVAAVLAAAGLEVLENGPYERFRHRVDQAIVRDIVIARKPVATA
jgi:hypothetical protein